MQSKVNKLIHSTIKLSSELGVAGASTAKIARHAGVATGTLYHHFSSKDQLISSAYLVIQKDYVWNVIGIFDYPKIHLDKRLQKFIKSSVDYWSRHRNSLLFTLQVYGSTYYTSALQLQSENENRHLIAALRQGAKQKILLKANVSTLYHLTFSAIIQTARLMINQHDEVSARRVRKIGVTFIWNAIKRVG